MTNVGDVTEANLEDMIVPESFAQKWFRLARQKKLGAFGAVVMCTVWHGPSTRAKKK